MKIRYSRSDYKQHLLKSHLDFRDAWSRTLLLSNLSWNEIGESYALKLKISLSTNKQVGKSTFNVLAQLRLRASFSAGVGNLGLTFHTKGGGVIRWDDTWKVTHPAVALTRPTLTTLPLTPLFTINEVTSVAP